MKLKALCNVQSGGTPSRSKREYWENGNIPWVKISDFISKHISSTEEMITKQGLECSSTKLFPKGTLLYTIFATLGEVCILDIDATTNQAIAGIMIENDSVEKEYLYYFLLSLKEQVNRIGRGVAQNNINMSILRDIDVPLPQRSEQQRIAKILNCTDNLIGERKEQLSLLDQLVKSRFIELFGTIHDNRFGFSVVTLQDVSAPIKDGTHQTPTYTTDSENGYKFLSSKDVTTGKIDWSHLKYIPEELHRELYARISPRKGDILLAKNGTTGIAAIVDRDEVFDIYVSLALIKPHGVNTTYLWAAINAAETKQQFDASLKGIGVPNLHLGEIKKARIILPPIELQEQFAAFVERTDKSKLVALKYININNPKSDKNRRIRNEL